MNYYNEFDPDAAAWLRELIALKLIPAGEVDTRSITDVLPSDLSGFTQCHFFAGIGGWPLALSLAGWPSNKPVGTGSCPCQPFSDAGKGLGFADIRHLWPAFFSLVVNCRALGQQWASVLFGEQVASKAGLEWLDGVFFDLEGAGYAVGAADLCAAGIGAPHIRQRLYWMADCESVGWNPELEKRSRCHAGDCPEERPARPEFSGGSYGLAQPDCYGSAAGFSAEGPREEGFTGISHDDSDQVVCGVANADGGNAGAEREQPCGEQRQQPGHGGGGFWSESKWLECRDGKHRRVPTEPALFPLADGLPYKLARRGSVRPPLLKGAGNAIVPELAAQFILASIEAKSLCL